MAEALISFLVSIIASIVAGYVLVPRALSRHARMLGRIPQKYRWMLIVAPMTFLVFGAVQLMTPSFNPYGVWQSIYDGVPNRGHVYRVCEHSEEGAVVYKLSIPGLSKLGLMSATSISGSTIGWSEIDDQGEIYLIELEKSLDDRYSGYATSDKRGRADFEIVKMYGAAKSCDLGLFEM